MRGGVYAEPLAAVSGLEGCFTVPNRLDSLQALESGRPAPDSKSGPLSLTTSSSSISY